MTTFTFGTAIEELSTLNNFQQFGISISTSTGNFVYESSSDPDAFRVSVTGSGFLFNGSGMITAGTVSEFVVTQNGVVVLTVTDANIVAADFHQGDLFDPQLQGDTVLISTGLDPEFGEVDPIPANAGITYGGDNTLSGTHFYVASLGIDKLNYTSTFVAGNSTIDASFEYASGDARGTKATSSVIGGNDQILFAEDNILYGDQALEAEGDVYRAEGQSTVVGGDDIVDFRASTNAITSRLISGDVQKAEGTSTVIGGDDILYGSTTQGTTIFGDVSEFVVGTSIVGGHDTIYGGTNDDIISGDTGATQGSDFAGGNDVIFGGGGNDVIYGQGGRDRITVGNGSSTAYGGDGNDYIRIEGNGSITVDGGDGRDKLSLSDSSGGVTVDLTTGAASRGKAANLTLSNFEDISGSSGGWDTITGTDGANKIYTYGGNDKVYGLGGGDKIVLGSGNDYVRAAEGNNTYYGESGTDKISYYASTDGVNVHLQNRTASGGHADGDKIGGFENLTGSGTGGDNIKGTNGANVIKTYGGADTINGLNGNDRLYGGNQNDRINGGKNNDSLYGGNGSDRLDGDLGDDMLWGGANADTFHFDKNDDNDVIKDFQNNVDTIEIDGYANGYNAMSMATQVGSDVVFDFGGGDTLTVENTSIGFLTNDLNVV